MSDSNPPPPLRTKSRLPFDPQPFSGAAKRGGVLVYGALVGAFVLLTLYFAVIEHRPLMSAHVAAPAIGAAWFALRLFMMMGPRS